VTWPEVSKHRFEQANPTAFSDAYTGPRTSDDGAVAGNGARLLSEKDLPAEWDLSATDEQRTQAKQARLRRERRGMGKVEAYGDITEDKTDSNPVDNLPGRKGMTYNPKDPETLPGDQLELDKSGLHPHARNAERTQSYGKGQLKVTPLKGYKGEVAMKAEAAKSVDQDRFRDNVSPEAWARWAKNLGWIDPYTADEWNQWYKDNPNEHLRWPLDPYGDDPYANVDPSKALHGQVNVPKSDLPKFEKTDDQFHMPAAAA